MFLNYIQLIRKHYFFGNSLSDFEIILHFGEIFNFLKYLKYFLKLFCGFCKINQLIKIFL